MLSRPGGLGKHSSRGSSSVAIPASAKHVWMFSEGSGTTVADTGITGGKPIDLSIGFNTTWEATGVRCADGRIETPALVSVRTIMLAYKNDFNSAYNGVGYLIAMGAGNSGITEVSGSSFTNVYQTLGESYHQVMRRVPPENGTQAYSLSSGGWTLVWLEYTSAQSTALWFAGRGGGGITTSRCAGISIAAAAAFTDTIPSMIASGDMQRAEDYFCNLLKSRSIYIRNRDCPTQAVGAMIIGESDMSGRGIITDLTAEEEARVFTNTTIMSSGGNAANATTPATLAIGVNQMVTDGVYVVGTNFGIELGIAASYETTTNSGRELVLSKTAKGSTFNAIINANGASDPAATTTWDTSVTPITVLLPAYAVREWFRLTSVMRNSGIGTPLLSVFNSLTKNDGKDVDYVGADAAAYKALRVRLKQFILTWTNTANVDWIELTCPSTFSGSNATAVANIQSAMTSWAAEDPSVKLVSTEGLGFLGDGIHWTSQNVHDLGRSMEAQATRLRNGA